MSTNLTDQRSDLCFCKSIQYYENKHFKKMLNEAETRKALFV